MKRMLSMLLMLVVSGYGFTAPSMMAANSVQSTSYQAEYENSMNRMHQEMMPSLQASNPDVAFAEGMLAHHKGAVKMAQIQLKYGHDQQMRKLAKEIIRAQEAEIKILQKWLQQHSNH